MATVAPTAAVTANESPKKNRIQVSNTKKPLFFYVNLAKRYIQQHNEVELSALGMAIATVVTISEILKNNGLATEKKVLTSTVGMKDENKGRLVQKAKIEIVLGRSEKSENPASSTKSENPASSTKSENPASSTKSENPVSSTKSENTASSTKSENTVSSTKTESQPAAEDKK